MFIHLNVICDAEKEQLRTALKDATLQSNTYRDQAESHAAQIRHLKKDIKHLEDKIKQLKVKLSKATRIKYECNDVGLKVQV